MLKMVESELNLIRWLRVLTVVLHCKPRFSRQWQPLALLTECLLVTVLSAVVLHWYRHNIGYDNLLRVTCLKTSRCLGRQGLPRQTLHTSWNCSDCLVHRVLQTSLCTQHKPSILLRIPNQMDMACWHCLPMTLVVHAT